MTNEEAILHLILRREELKFSFGDIDKDIKVFNMAIEALEQTRWIPVSERLPEEYDLYLVYTEEQPFVCPFENGEFFIDDVLAWMPLPQPYKGESEEEE